MSILFLVVALGQKYNTYAETVPGTRTGMREPILSIPPATHHPGTGFRTSGALCGDNITHCFCAQLIEIDADVLWWNTAPEDAHWSVHARVEENGRFRSVWETTFPNTGALVYTHIDGDDDNPFLVVSVKPGDTLRQIVDGKNEGLGVVTIQLVFNGTVLYEETVVRTVSTGTFYFGWGRWYAGMRIEKPVVLAAPDVVAHVGDPVNWNVGILARWGISTEKLIPTHGSIVSTSLVGGTVGSLSVDGNVFSHVGQEVLEYIIRDDHSLSSLYPFDDSFTSVSRTITVRTMLNPTLQIIYSNNAHAALVGNIYDPILPLACNGESGWTKEPLDIFIDTGAIVGTFDTLLTLPDFVTTATNMAATRTNYHIESINALGTPISGVLTGVGDASNLLSGTVNGFVKIDKTNPMPAATHISGYNFTDDSTDSLSGISLTRPGEIALTATGGPQPMSGDFNLFDAIPPVSDGTYDVWVSATDKAGNTATKRVLTDILILNSAVEITKDTDQVATLHVVGCPDFDSASVTSCTSECSLGANVEIEEKSSLTYKLTLTNTDLSDTASGTFEDYLPEGTIVSTLPTVTPAGSATVTFDLETTGPYTGRYKVSGTYTNLAPSGQIEIDILTRAPAFDKVTAMNNIITNQASTNWTIGTGPSECTGSTESNYAVHELLEIPSVETLFTKVGANDLDLGLVGTEFALYRWKGALAPTTAEQKHIIDYNVLVDNTLPGGDWVRVTYDGEDALALTDIFVSSASPLGEVDLGSLPEGVYTLIETKTVGGYALPMGQWILTIDPDKGDTGANDWKIEFAGKSNSIAPPAAIRDESVPNAPTYKIVNAEPFLIGLSGLEGTTGMLLTGFIIMAIATNAYLVRRHKQREK